MILLQSQNENTYNQIKKDREILIERIKSSQALLEEFDLVYPILDSVFNPQIKIQKSGKKENQMYMGLVSVLQPNDQAPVDIRFNIGKVENYTDMDDVKLHNDAKTKARNRIKESFPQYFK